MLSATRLASSTALGGLRCSSAVRCAAQNRSLPASPFCSSPRRFVCAKASSEEGGGGDGEVSSASSSTSPSPSPAAASTPRTRPGAQAPFKVRHKGKRCSSYYASKDECDTKKELNSEMIRRRKKSSQVLSLFFSSSSTTTTTTHDASVFVSSLCHSFSLFLSLSFSADKY